MDNRVCSTCKAQKPLDRFPLERGSAGVWFRRRQCCDCRRLVRQASWKAQCQKVTVETRKTQKCRVCFKRRPITGFYLLTTKGLATRAKECTKCVLLRLKTHRSLHLVEMSQKNKAAHRSLRDQLIAGYGSRCVCCGESRREFLALDHTYNDGALERKTSSSIAIYRRAIKSGFPGRYRLLCHNCNMAREFSGYCPHDRELSFGSGN